MTIQILRLKDGYDLVSDVVELENSYQLIDPMLFEVHKSTLIVQQWLPIGIVKNDFVILNKSDILCVMEPNDEFCDYYSSMVSKVKDVLDKSKVLDGDQEDLENIALAMEELESSKGILIH